VSSTITVSRRYAAVPQEAAAGTDLKAIDQATERFRQCGCHCVPQVSAVFVEEEDGAPRSLYVSLDHAHERCERLAERSAGCDHFQYTTLALYKAGGPRSVVSRFAARSTGDAARLWGKLCIAWHLRSPDGFAQHAPKLRSLQYKALEM
jgi:hypothetical protein